MILVDVDKFLSYLIYSKHIDGLTCGEVKEAIEMCKVDVLGKIRERIELEKLGYPPSAGYYKAIMKCLQIIDKYREPQGEMRGMMELISKEVVRRIIDSERTREQMLEMAESAVAVEECEDCISRSEAIRIASGYCHWTRIPEELAKLPPVKPKEITGEWIQHEENGSYWVECSVCHSERAFGHKFCPDCGAKMKE